MCTTFDDTNNKLKEWFYDITECESFKKCGIGTDCELICKCQEFNKGKRQLPEPYNGNPQEAKIVFISSNPNIGYWEDNPTEKWKNKDIFNFFNYRFDENTPKPYCPYVIFQNKNKEENYQYYTRCVENVTLSEASNEKTEELRVSRKEWSEGKYTTRYYKTLPVPFWGKAAQIADELLNLNGEENPLKYCLFTEVIHCKSKGEEGIKEAMKPCRENFFEKFLEILCEIWKGKNRDVLIAIVTGNEAMKSINKFLKNKNKPTFKTTKNAKITKITMKINEVDVWFIATTHLSARSKKSGKQLFQNPGDFDAIKEELEKYNE